MDRPEKAGFASKLGSFFGALIAIPIGVYFLASSVGADLRGAMNLVDTVRGKGYNCAQVAEYFQEIGPGFHDLAEVLSANDSEYLDFVGTAAYVYTVAETTEPDDDLTTFHTRYFALTRYLFKEMETDARLAGGDEAVFESHLRKYVDPVDEELRKISRHCPDETREFRSDFWGYAAHRRFV